jgi:hypothetical protein
METKTKVSEFPAVSTSTIVIPKPTVAVKQKLAKTGLLRATASPVGRLAAGVARVPAFLNSHLAERKAFGTLRMSRWLSE